MSFLTIYLPYPSHPIQKPSCQTIPFLTYLFFSLLLSSLFSLFNSAPFSPLLCRPPLLISPSSALFPHSLLSGYVMCFFLTSSYLIQSNLISFSSVYQNAPLGPAHQVSQWPPIALLSHLLMDPFECSAVRGAALQIMSCPCSLTVAKTDSLPP